MATKEEIEAAAKRYAEGDYPKHWNDIGAWDEYWQPIQFADDERLLAEVFVAERAERKQLILAAAEAIRHESTCQRAKRSTDALVALLTGYFG